MVGMIFYYCTKCESKLPDWKSVGDHLVSKHNVKEKKIETKYDTRLEYIPPNDSESYPIKKLLKRFGSHFIRSGKNVKCPDCGSVGAISIKNSKNFECLECGKRFKSTEGAYMDGIFLNETPIPERYGEYIGEGLKEVDVEEKAGDIAKKLIKKLEGKKSGRSPRTLAASALYLACLATGERRTQRDISEAFNITIVSLRDNYRYIIDNTEDIDSIENVRELI